MIQLKIENRKTYYSQKLDLNVSRKEGSRLSSLQNYFIPILSPTERNFGNGIQIKLRKDINTVQGHLLWYCLYQGITSLEFYILFEILNSHIRGGNIPSAVYLYGVLKTSGNTRKRLLDWSSHTKSIHRQFEAKKPSLEYQDQELIYSFLDEIHLNLQIPQRVVPRTSLYSYSSLILKPISKKAPNFVGVGYKDKGSLGGNGIAIPPEEVLDPENDFDFSSLLSNWNKLLRRM